MKKRGQAMMRLHSLPTCRTASRPFATHAPNALPPLKQNIHPYPAYLSKQLEKSRYRSSLAQSPLEYNAIEFNILIWYGTVTMYYNVVQCNTTYTIRTPSSSRPRARSVAAASRRSRRSPPRPSSGTRMAHPRGRWYGTDGFGLSFGIGDWCRVDGLYLFLWGIGVELMGSIFFYGGLV